MQRRTVTYHNTHANFLRLRLLCGHSNFAPVGTATRTLGSRYKHSMKALGPKNMRTLAKFFKHGFDLSYAKSMTPWRHHWTSGIAYFLILWRHALAESHCGNKVQNDPGVLVLVPVAHHHPYNREKNPEKWKKPTQLNLSTSTCTWQEQQVENVLEATSPKPIRIFFSFLLTPIAEVEEVKRSYSTAQLVHSNP